MAIPCLIVILNAVKNPEESHALLFLRIMEIYIEYALIENFCMDCALLYLALKCVKLPVRRIKLFVSAFLGACFAVAFPFFSGFGKGATTLLKATFPLFLCAVAFDRKNAKGGGRYAAFALCFYLLSFAFAGGVYAFCALFSVPYAYGEGIIVQAPVGLVFSGTVGVGALCCSLVKRLYERGKRLRFVYPCEVSANGRSLRINGLIDSGNVAQKNGSPVCFLSSECFFELFGAESFSLPFEEMAVASVSGEKKIKLVKLDEIKIYCGKTPNIIKQPYCSPSYTFRAREYKILLGAWALDGENT